MSGDGGGGGCDAAGYGQSFVTPPTPTLTPSFLSLTHSLTFHSPTPKPYALLSFPLHLLHIVFTLLRIPHSDSLFSFFFHLLLYIPVSCYPIPQQCVLPFYPLPSKATIGPLITPSSPPPTLSPLLQRGDEP